MTNNQTKQASDEGTDKPNLFLQREREIWGSVFEGLFCFVTIRCINIHLHIMWNNQNISLSTLPMIGDGRP
jgi:hypothetical protein